MVRHHGTYEYLSNGSLLTSNPLPELESKDSEAPGRKSIQVFRLVFVLGGDSTAGDAPRRGTADDALYARRASGQGLAPPRPEVKLSGCRAPEHPSSLIRRWLPPRTCCSFRKLSAVAEEHLNSQIGMRVTDVDTNNQQAVET